VQEINIGMTADVGTFPRLCKLIPDGWVRELAYAGRRLDAASAERIAGQRGVRQPRSGDRPRHGPRPRRSPSRDAAGGLGLDAA
jgi:hypothetical protein